MNYKELLYNKDNVLSIYPELAVVLNTYDEIKFSSQSNNDKKKKPDRSGLNKAIVINQINYWNGKNENKNRNFFDGHFWSYNSYAGWSKTNFPFWSPTTVKRIFNSLENDGIIISCKNNRLKIDNTKWYRINYERLQEIIDIVEKYRSETNAKDVENHDNCHNDHTSGHNDQTTGSECTDKEVRVTRPLPENNNREYSSEITDSNKVFSNEKTIYNNKVSPTGETYRSPDIPYDYTEEEFKDFITKKTDHILHGISPEEKYASVKPISAIISYFYKRYYECIGERHPILTDMVYAKIIMKLLDPSDEVYRRGFCLDEMAYSAMIDKFFQTDYGVKSGNFTDYRMPYFMQDTVQNNLVYSAGVV